ncbi:exo-alpha-sialidase [Archangium violaceum]|uniref:sialidase family protein n=1 Tax=Archangium violaceum TaxID=83451 RepID=UPI001950C1CF|nr:sialidase family protein [Archangium violaceum]QRN94499.1 exo-alpha-sialidase [Archangium violaceum]
MPVCRRLAALLGALVLLSACPTQRDPDEVVVADGEGFPLEFATPPVEGGDPRVLQQVEAMGDSVYLDTVNVFVSFDKRRTWKEINAAALGSIQKWVFVTPTAGLALTGKHGLAYIELDKDIIYYLNGEPAWSAWGYREDGTVFTVRQEVDAGTGQTGDEKARVWLGRRRDFTQDAPWPEVELPSLPFSYRTYRPSVHFGADGAIYVASYFGLQVSRDDGQSWQQVPVLQSEQGSIDWSGVDLFVTRAGTLFARTQNTAFVSRDGGASWVGAPMPGGLANRSSMIKMEEPVPGELHFRDLAYRSTDEGRSYQQDFTLERYGFRQSLGTLFFRGGEYYFHMDLLSNFVGAAPDTALHILNPHQGASVAPTNLRRAFPQGGGRYTGLWNQGVITYTPGDVEWRVEHFFDNTYFLQRLRDGRLALAHHLGLRFSRDEGATWSEPVRMSNTSTNSVTVKALVETPGRLFVSGSDNAGCDRRALLESRDEGASWQPVTAQIIQNPEQSPVSPRYQPEVTTADPSGRLWGFVSDLSGCRAVDSFAASSEDQGRTWQGVKDRVPLAATSRGNLLTIKDDSADEAILFWERSHEEWKPFGAPRMDGATVPNLFVGQPFIHVDAEDFVYFVDGQRVLKSTRPVE